MSMLKQLYEAKLDMDRDECSPQSNLILINNGEVEGNLYNLEQNWFIIVTGKARPDEDVYEGLRALLRNGRFATVRITVNGMETQFLVMTEEDIKDVFRVLDLLADGYAVSN